LGDCCLLGPRGPFLAPSPRFWGPRLRPVGKPAPAISLYARRDVGGWANRPKSGKPQGWTRNSRPGRECPDGPRKGKKLTSRRPIWFYGPVSGAIAPFPGPRAAGALGRGGPIRVPASKGTTKFFSTRPGDGPKPGCWRAADWTPFLPLPLSGGRWGPNRGPKANWDHGISGRASPAMSPGGKAQLARGSKRALASRKQWAMAHRRPQSTGKKPEQRAQQRGRGGPGREIFPPKRIAFRQPPTRPGQWPKLFRPSPPGARGTARKKPPRPRPGLQPSCK